MLNSSNARVHHLLPSLAGIIRETPAVRNDEVQSFRFCERDQTLRISRGKRHRFFAQHVTPGGQSGGGVLVVKVVRGTHYDPIETVEREDFPVVFGRKRDFELLLDLSQLLLANPTNRNHFYVRKAFQYR